ncbi:MAG TPA: single-stranded DNA-binding protein [Desulfurobacteriaceae bacterium]|nr:single-stranded DNA-binding protein [Desulfurobacteriaceae bacterium]
MAQINLNKVFLIGRIVRDAELSYTSSGSPYTRFSLVTSRYYKKKEENNFQEESTFVDVVIWGNQAERVIEHLTKGTSVFVEGRLRSFKTEKGYYKVEVVCEKIQIISSKSKSEKSLKKETEETKIEDIELSDIDDNVDF